jgi:hypothetical protein
MDDLEKYFRGDVWKEKTITETNVDAKTDNYSVNLEQSDVQYYWTIESMDDPSDAADGVSPEPTKEIVEFLSENLPGAEFFTQMASKPRQISLILRRLASDINKGAALSEVISMLKRIGASLNYAEVKNQIHQILRIAVDNSIEEEEINKLKKKLKDKGWDVILSETEFGAPKLEVNIGDIYKASIEVESVLYDYEFGFKGRPDLTEKGSTNDPIQAFKSYYRNPVVEEAWQEAKHEESRIREQETAPSGKKKETEQKTIPSKKREEWLDEKEMSLNIPKAKKPLEYEETIPV